jgi:hypothetical protein
MGTSGEICSQQPFVRRNGPLVWSEPDGYHFWWKGYIGRIASSVHDSDIGAPYKDDNDFAPVHEYEQAFDTEPLLQPDAELIDWPDQLEEPHEPDSYVAEFTGTPPLVEEEKLPTEHPNWEVYDVTTLCLPAYGISGREFDNGAVYWERGQVADGPEDAEAFVLRGLAYCLAPDSPPVEGDEQRGLYSMPEWGLTGYNGPTIRESGVSAYE